MFRTLAVCLLFAACSTPAAPSTTTDAADTSKPDTAAETVEEAKLARTDAYVNNYAQGYGATLTFKGGPADGWQIKLDRDFYSETIKCPPVFSFGSSHLTPPAVAFAVTDQPTVKAKHQKSGADVEAPLFVVMQFGILVKSAKEDAQTGDAKPYPFSCGAPYLEIGFKNVTYKSTCKGLNGTVDVKEWAASEKGRFAGQFKGTLQAYAASGAVDDCGPSGAEKCSKQPTWTVDVDGVFGFELPAPDCKGDK
jgi:hypothetical protein